LIVRSACREIYLVHVVVSLGELPLCLAGRVLQRFSHFVRRGDGDQGLFYRGIVRFCPYSCAERTPGNWVGMGLVPVVLGPSS